MAGVSAHPGVRKAKKVCMHSEDSNVNTINGADAMDQGGDGDFYWQPKEEILPH